ncbi:DUF3144 domain-containing protein [Acinetobacter sp. C26M]|uniref:DUF3144 domain-containing protein n=1 Tax=unclassified Acinetobacter TaxID=196816 RepID=UPI00203746D4|nr:MULTISPECIES: DUF3144 domain-containing protein [unclassified Acinetobacter]USA45830.1 DUF3144 domain-containing protein [Acinetobacter sp. C26M]USA49313.1 DUF3144 domain-containing protein [Acinetobacter sp. C26G]
MQNTDDEFYERADQHIRLSNQQITKEIGKGKVSASMLFATSRFNAWISASGWETAEELANAKQETIEYFLAEYRKMLEENLDEYIENFEEYMFIPPK